jgi:hypothetical protein
LLLPVPHQPAFDSDGDVIMVTPEQAAARVETTGRDCLLCGRMHGNRECSLVRDWERGACGTELHLLESRLGAVAV